MPPPPPLLLFFAIIFVAAAIAAPPPASAPGQSPAPIPDLADNAAPPSSLSPMPSPAADSPSSAPAPQPPEPSLVPSPSSFESFSPFSAPPGVESGPSDSPTSPAEPPQNDGGPSDSSINTSSTITWCAVRDELEDCQFYLGLLEPNDYEWSCVRKPSTLDCLDAIRDKEADLIALDAGLAYIAFKNYSMKAILGEEYCYHSSSYDAVAVVNKRMCDENSKLSFEDFRGLKSCHPGYLTAAGWNYPVQFLVNTSLRRPLIGYENTLTDEAVVSDFFSEMCAPSEFEGTGICTSCGNNGSCPSDSIYEGYSGAFRCLMEGVGDIAFLRSDTAQRLSGDGFNAQAWSTKSVNDFMYVCPGGGCQPINENIRTCSFGTVPGNAIMTYNALSNAKRQAIVKTLLNASWTDALYSGKNWNDHLLSASTQNLVEVTELTRSYLGNSAVVSQSVQTLRATNISSLPISGGFHVTAIPCLLIFASLIAALPYHY